MSDDIQDPSQTHDLGLHWLRAGRQGMGSAALAERLRTSLDLLDRQLGVQVPNGCRPRNALAFLDRMNGLGCSPESVGDAAFERQLLSHDRTA